MISPKRIFQLLSCLILASCASSSSKEPDDSIQSDLLIKLDQKVIAEIEEKKIPSIAVGVIKDGNVVVAKAYGFADLESQTKADENTVYQLGSVTKMFTGQILSSLVADNVMAFADPVAKYFPDTLEFPQSPTGQEVTIRDIVTHSSEFPRYPYNLDRIDPHPIKGYTYAQMLEGISKVQIDTVIGIRYNYSNFGFGVLGTAMENATGKTLSELMNSRIFSKYNLESSSLILDDGLSSKLATPYLETDPVIETEPWDMGTLSAAGSVFSTVNDLNQLMLGMLAENEINNTQQQPYLQINDTWAYGLGCFIVDSEKLNTQLIYHGGDIDGYASSLTLYPEYKLGVVILTNWGEGQSIGPAFSGIYDIVTDHFIK